MIDWKSFFLGISLAANLAVIIAYLWAKARNDQETQNGPEAS